LNVSLKDRRGFTLIELITVCLLIGILSAMASLRYIALENEGLAAKVGAEMQEIRLASITYFSENETWPAPASEGTIPTELAPLLSGATSWQNADFTLEWVNQGEDLVGVIVRGSRPGLTDKLISRLVYGNPYVSYGADVMYIIKAPGISM
jgi:prepilin-type N-terminal cleavage/methylation domain-containing protein